MAPFDQLGSSGSDGLGMAPRVGEPESNLIPGMAAPLPPGSEIGPPGVESLLGPLVPPNITDTSTAAPQPPGLSLQEPPRWQYDFDPSSGLARATFPGEIGFGSIAPGSGVTPTGPAGGALSGTYPNPTLATVIAAAGPIGSSAAIPVLTFNAAGQLTAVTTAGVPGATGGQTFLAADFALNNVATVFNVLATPALGAAGQVFDIEVSTSLTNPGGLAGPGVGIFDGTNYLFATIVTLTSGSVRVQTTFSVRTAALAGPTTFTFRAQDAVSANTLVAASGGSPFGIANHATYIKWTRVA